MSDDDLPSSPPSLTHSPDNRHVAAAGKKGKQTKAQPIPAMMATSELQALLPRRRVRRPRADRDVFDVESDEEDEDADELSMVAPARTNRRTPAPPKQITKLKAAAAGRSKRSYGKKAAEPEADKENDDEENEDDDDAHHSLAPISDSIEEGESSILDGKVGKELKKAKKKFMDVDKWEMEFESVTAEGSSQADAR